MNDEKLFNKIVCYRDTSSPVLEDYKKNLSKFRDMYLCKRKNKKNSSLANVFVPEFFKAIETIVSNMYKIIIAEDPFFTTIGRTAQDNQNAKIIHNAMVYYLDSMKFKKELRKWLRYFLINGSIVIKVTWCYEEKDVINKVLVPNPNGLPPMVQQKEDTVIKNDRPDIELIDLLDLFLDPSATSLEDSEWIIHRKKVTKHQLHQLYKNGIIDKQINTKDYNGKNEKSNEDILKDEKMQDLGINITEYTKAEYEILEFWGYTEKGLLADLSPDEEGYDEEEVLARVIVCTDTKEVLKKSEIIYHHKEKPFIGCNMFEFEDSPFSFSLGDIMEKPQTELNDFHNQALDFNCFSIYNMWLRHNESGIDKTKLKPKPNLIIDTNDMLGLQALRPNASALIQNFQTESGLREDIKQGMGALASMQGVPSSKRQTKREIDVLFGEGSMRVEGYALIFAEGIIKPMLQMTYKLIAQFMDRDITIRIMDDEGINFQPISPDNIYGEYDFIPKLMTDYVNAITIRENLIEFMSVIFKDPMTPPNVKQYFIMKYYESLGFKDVAKLKELYEQMQQQMNVSGETPQENDPETEQLAEKVLDKLGI